MCMCVYLKTTVGVLEPSLGTLTLRRVGCGPNVGALWDSSPESFGGNLRIGYL